MRFKFFIFLVSVFIVGCTSSEKPIIPVNSSVNKFTGAWQLSETYVSPGGVTSWKNVEDGEKIDFRMDGSFTIQNTSRNCKSGNFSVEDDMLVFKCRNTEELKYIIAEFSEKEMILSGVGCIEACLYKYRRR